MMTGSKQLLLVTLLVGLLSIVGAFVGPSVHGLPGGLVVRSPTLSRNPTTKLSAGSIPPKRGDDSDDDLPFALRDTTTTMSTPTTTKVDGSGGGSSSSSAQFDPSEAMASVQDAFAKLDLDFDAGALSDSFDALRENLTSGKVGERGELYTAAQVVVMFCLLIGGVPIVGNAATILGGPCLLLAGLAVSFLAFKDLGSSLSPWPSPPTASDGKLVTTGIYEQMRHPMYAGLLAACAGFSIVTGSANRLLLTAVLLYVLDVKSDKEEEELAKVFPDYGAYKSKVPGKFFPQAVLDELPWGNK